MEETTEEPEPVVEPEVAEPEVTEPEPVLPVVNTSEAEVVKAAESEVVESEPEKPAEKPYSKYMISNLSELKSGNYYIQIAALRDESNIMEIVNKYGKNYPITISPNDAGTVNIILIGPLSVDEYATVLARFKAFGYKDAFVRKIK